MPKPSQGFIERTDAKLRYAQIHLEALRQHPELNSGDDFGNAHQEAFLFQLFGARDAFFQELNIYYDCNLTIDKVSLFKLKEACKKKSCDHPELEYIENLEKDDTSWLSRAKKMRDHSTHRFNLSRGYYLGGDYHGQVHLRVPDVNTPVEKQILIEEHITDLFSEWLNEITKMVNKLRANVSARVT